MLDLNGILLPAKIMLGGLVVVMLVPLLRVLLRAVVAKMLDD